MYSQMHHWFGPTLKNHIANNRVLINNIYIIIYIPIYIYRSDKHKDQKHLSSESSALVVVSGATDDMHVPAPNITSPAS